MRCLPAEAGSARSALRILAPLLASLGLGCIGRPEVPPPPEPTPPLASLSGRLVAAGERLPAADLARAIVYLDRVQGVAADAPRMTSELRHHAERLAPDLLVVAPGDTVWLVNDDRIFHGAFSYSRPNAFTLGDYGPGERRQIQFAHAGTVRIHCRFHPEESSLVFVTPTRLVGRPAPNGSYQIAGVAAGRYWLKVWIDGLPEKIIDITLRPGESAFRDIAWSEREAASAAAGDAPAATALPAQRQPEARPRPGIPGSRGSPILPTTPAVPRALRPLRRRAARAPGPSRRWSA